MTTTYKRIQDAALATVENGGGTFALTTMLPYDLNAGYSVGRKQFSYVVDLAPGNWVEQVVQEIERYRDGLWLEDEPIMNWLGTWIHDGKLYLDAPVVIGDRRCALDWAREQGELAIYDFANGEEITV